MEQQNYYHCDTYNDRYKVTRIVLIQYTIIKYTPFKKMYATNSTISIIMEIQIKRKGIQSIISAQLLGRNTEMSQKIEMSLYKNII